MGTATKSVAIRLALDGRAEVKAGLKDIGDTGKQTGQDVARGMDMATSAADRQRAVFDRLVLSARQAKQQSQGQSSWATSLGMNRPSATAAGAPSSEAEWLKAEAAASQDLANRSAALRAQIDPLGTAQLRMNAAVADADQLLAKKTITEAEHAAAVKLAAKEYAAAEQALKHFGGTSSMSTAQVMALTHSVRGAMDAIIAGRNPVQALAMESGHLSYALGGGVGLAGVANLAKSALTALLSPTALLIGGFLGVGAGVATAVMAYRAAIQDQKDLEASLAGVGRTAGVTSAQMEEIAQSTHDSASVSVSEAHKMEEQFASTGKIGGELFGNLIGLVRDYAATTHQNTDQATKDLAAIFSDPAKGVDMLIQKVGGIDDKTRQYILTLAAQGERQKAQLELLKALPPNLEKASEATDGLGRAAHSLDLSWQGVWESIKRAVSAPGLGQQLADLRKERADAAVGQGKTLTTSVGDVSVAPRPLKDIDSDISAVQGKLDGLATHAKTVAATVDAAGKSIAVGNLARSVLGFGELDALVNGQKELNKQMADPAVRGHIANLQQAKDAQDAYSRAIATYLTPAQKAAALDDLEAKALNDKTPKQKADTAAKREAIEISGKMVTTAQAASDVDRARAKALNEASRAGQDQAKQNALNAAALDAETVATLASARAWLVNAAAGQKADSAIRAAGDAAKKHTDQESEARRLLAQNIAEATRGGAQQANQMTAQAAKQRELNDAVAAGTMNSDDARQAMQTWSALRPLTIAQDLAEGDAKKTLTEVIKALTAAYANDNVEQRRTQAQQMVEDQRLNIGLLQQELGLQNEGEEARERDLAVMQAKTELLRQHISLASAEGQEYVANALKAAGLNQQLRLVDASRQEVEGMFDSLANQASNFFTSSNISWKSFGDLGLSALKDIESEFIKLALINPVKNELFGSGAPTLSSVGSILGGLGGGSNIVAGESAGVPDSFWNKMFPGGASPGGIGSWLSSAGSWVASLFHDGLNSGPVGAGAGAGRNVPSRLFRNARRMHGGGLVGDEVPIIAKKGELVGWPDQFAKAFGSSSVLYAPAQTHYHLEGAVVTQDLLDQMNAMNAQSERRAAATAVKQSRRAMGGWQQQNALEHG